VRPFTFRHLTFNADEEGAGAFTCFDPARPEATDTGPNGMVAEMDAFLRLTKGKRCLVDAGALFGVFSLAFCAENPDGAAYAFEPSPWAYPVLEAHAGANPDLWVLPVNQFLGEERGRNVRCTRDWKHVIANLDREGERFDATEGRLDDWIAPYIHVDVLKIDVEAYECQVLRGARKLVERCRPLLFVECHLENLPDNGESRGSLYALLRELGYRVTFLDGSPVETFEGTEGMTRVIGWPE
jgi:FkbM family methyltransferase